MTLAEKTMNDSAESLNAEVERLRMENIHLADLVRQADANILNRTYKQWYVTACRERDALKAAIKELREEMASVRVALNKAQSND
jgi:DNA anti-recombination protein RmuC